MSTEKEIASFLKELKEKMRFWDILFRDDRGKNTQALVDLELRPIDRKATLEALVAKDYSEGPLEEKLYGGPDMWVFGKTIKKKEVYIKIREPLLIPFFQETNSMNKVQGTNFFE